MASEDAAGPVEAEPATPVAAVSLVGSPVWGFLPRSRFAAILGASLVSSLADMGTVFLMYVLGARLSGGAVVETGISGTLLGRLDGLAERLVVDPLLLLSGLFLLSIVVRHVVRILTERAIIRLQFDLLRSFSRRLFHGYFRLSYETFVERNSIDRIHSITAETTRSGQATSALIRIFTQSLNILLLLLLLLAVEWKAFVFAVVTGVLLVIVVRPIATRSRAFGQEIRGATKDLWTSIMEPFRAYRVIVTADAAQVFERDVARKTERNFELLRRMTYSQQQQAPIMELTIGAMIFAGIVLALYASSDPAAGFPLILLAIAGSYRILPAIAGLSSAYNSYRINEPAVVHVLQELRDIETFHDPPGLHRAAPTQDGCVLALRRVSFRYRKGGDVLQDVDLAIRSGERVGIVGPSGSGKSTLIDLALGLLRPTSGEVQTARRPDGTPMRVGYVPQQLILLDDTVLANLCLGQAPAAWDRGKAQHALDRVGLGAAGLHPVSLDLAVGEGGVRLSGGQRQRLGIARALYRDPDVLLLDEPTAALDVASEEQVMQALAGLEGIPMLIVTHRERPLVLCDRVLRIEGGRLLPSLSVERHP